LLGGLLLWAPFEWVLLAGELDEVVCAMGEIPDENPTNSDGT